MVFNKPLKLKILSLLVLLPSIIFSQPGNSSVGKTILNDFKHFGEFGWELTKAPVNFDNRDIKILTAGVASLGAVSLLDQEFRTFVIKNQSKFGREFFKIDHYYGNFYSLIPPAILYVYGLSFSDKHTRLVGWKTFESFVYAGLISYGFKYLIGRERPYVDGEVYDFKPLDGRFRNRSLPSGHSTVSFAVSFSMAELYENYLWKGMWISLATFTSLARTYDDKHWFSDILTGAGIGYVVSSFNFSSDKDFNNYSFYLLPNEIGLILRL